ncbi:MAG: ferritin family protein [bacterium]
MPALPKTAVEAIEMAIAAELDAQATYLQLANTTQSQDAKLLYQNLARDEQWHKELLDERYQALTGNKQPKSASGGPSIEGAVVRMKAKENMDEMEILQLAISAEIAAFEFYTKTTAAIIDPETRTMFLRLSEDEARHRNLLEKEVQARQGKPTDEMELDNWVRE